MAFREKQKRMAQGEGGGRWPPWLGPLLSTRFFAQCELHLEYHKSECNMFCLDCPDHGALCSPCLAYHHGHRVIQIRRSSYHDVIRVSEIQRLLDIAEVQTYIINSARVVFLNERPQPRPGKGVTNTCHVCRRGLLDNFRFCSLGCKVAGTRRDHGSLDDFRRKKERLTVETTRSDSEGSCTTTSDPRVSNFTTKMPATTTATTSFRSVTKRRKGIPQRAPFGAFLFDY